MLSESLKVFYGTSFAFFVKSFGFHHNVEGPDFVSLHKLFGKIYEDAFESLDKIAEYIRTEEDYAPGSFERFQELSLIQGQTKVPRARLMIEELLADTQTMKDLSKNLFDQAAEVGREDVANFAAERQSQHGKYAWQLKSLLKDQRA
jgi:starvation-inducible DNA-binding protein